MTDLKVKLAVPKLAERWNPFRACVWDINSPVRMSEIRNMVKSEDVYAPDEHVVAFRNPNPNTRANHMRRIAWFVVNGWDDPIEVDFGVPSLGCHVNWPIENGNHRYAAAIIRDDNAIMAMASGEIKTIKKYQV